MAAFPTLAFQTPIPLSVSVVLGLSAVVGSYGLACVFPFAALATVAALTMSRSTGMMFMAAVWAANQIVGFALLSYPFDIATFGWGIALGVASQGALLAALSVCNARPVGWVASLCKLAAAFAAYEATLLAVAIFAGGLETFSLPIVATIGRDNLLAFAVLCALGLGLQLLTADRRIALHQLP